MLPKYDETNIRTKAYINVINNEKLDPIFYSNSFSPYYYSLYYFLFSFSPKLSNTLSPSPFYGKFDLFFLFQ